MVRNFSLVDTSLNGSIATNPQQPSHKYRLPPIRPLLSHSPPAVDNGVY
jgi:hypothetical protein